jgi:hypothetical protein
MRILALLLVVALSPIAGARGDELRPDVQRDTLSPVYDWKTLPLAWDDIVAGKLPVSPTHWQRHPGNPIVPRGMNCRPVLWDNNTIRVFYGRRGRGGGICFFDVAPDQPAEVVNGPVGPIITTGERGTYDDEWLIAPELVRISDSHLRMYYSAKRSGRDFFKQAWSLALAESFDSGQTWRKHTSNPILTVGEDEWESGAVGFCSIERDGRSWKMWYLGTNTQQNAIKQVGFATSTDGLDWKRHASNPVIRIRRDFHWEAGAIAVPRVIRDGALYKVWYCSYPQNNTYVVGQAESFDGLKWFRSPGNPVLRGSGKGWDSGMTAYPGVIRVGDRYLMWYSGNGYGSQGIGLATADAPRGHWLLRTASASEGADPAWSSWKPLPKHEPQRTGVIQFAIINDSPQK